MCFSPTASFIASAAIGTAGIATLRKKKTKSETLFALIPILFAIQQFIEGIVWISFDSPTVHTVATYIYVIFAYALWPIFIPITVHAIEPRESRKKILFGFVVLGLVFGTYILSLILKNPVSCQILNKSILYDIHYNSYFEITGTLYLMATCMSFFFSSEKIIKIGGFITCILFLIAIKIYEATFASVWCFFEAGLSIMIYFYFHWKYQDRALETSTSPVYDQ